MDHGHIFYFYGEASESFVQQFRDSESGEEITFVPFTAKGTFPAVDREQVGHVIVSGDLDEIKLLLGWAKEQQCSVGIVPLPGQDRIRKVLAIPSDPMKALAIAAEPAEKKIDLLYCNDLLVLSDVCIGNTAVLREYEYQFAEYGILKRFTLLWKAYRHRREFRHVKFSIKTEKEESLSLSAVGMIALGYNNKSWIAARLAKRLSALDGQHLLLVLSPLSLMQYFIVSPLSLFFSRWRRDMLPSSCGYIKSSYTELESEETVRVRVDDRESLGMPVVLRTENEALALSVGASFWEEQPAGRTERNSIRIDNVPKDEETIEYLGEGLPLFKHASKEQYASLFSSLREESTLSRTFVILLLIATIIATLGLFIDSSSVIIGAMILAPLMQPIVSLSMGVLRQDESLTKRSSKTIAWGILLTLAASMLFAYFAPIHEMTGEMTSRLSPTILDMMIAIASGVAAAYVKNNEKISASIAGVAIAVALVPPLAVSGIGLGWGDWHIFLNAFMLFLTNLIGIVLAGALTFLMLGFAPIHVAKRGILIWALIALSITVPLYHSFERMKEASNVRSALMHVKFDINGREIYLNRVEYIPRGREVEIRCEVITNEKLRQTERSYLKNMITQVVGKPTVVTARFSYRL